MCIDYCQKGTDVMAKHLREGGKRIWRHAIGCMAATLWSGNRATQHESCSRRLKLCDFNLVGTLGADLAGFVPNCDDFPYHRPGCGQREGSSRAAVFNPANLEIVHACSEKDSCKLSFYNNSQ